METLTRILCVDDDPDIGTLARFALQTMGGFTVEVCGSGPEALDALSRFTPDLILLDVVMPGMDGPAALAELRKTDVAQGVPVIFLTAKGKPAEASRYRELGAAGVIPKPFDPITLASAVRALWAAAGAS